MPSLMQRGHSDCWHSCLSAHLITSGDSLYMGVDQYSVESQVSNDHWYCNFFRFGGDISNLLSGFPSNGHPRHHGPLIEGCSSVTLKLKWSARMGVEGDRATHVSTGSVGPILWMDEILHHFETMKNNFVCWYLQSKSHSRVSERWCNMDFATIHNSNGRVPLFHYPKIDLNPSVLISPSLQGGSPPVVWFPRG